METGEHILDFHNYKAIINIFLYEGLREALVNTLIMSGFQIVFLLPWGFFLTYFLYKKIILTHPSQKDIMQFKG